MSIEMISTIASGAALSVLAKVLAERFTQKKDGNVTLEQRIEQLTNSLSRSSSLVSEIEREIQSRQQLVATLQQDAERYEKLITLNQEQVDAVAQLLQGELRKEGRSSFWKGVLVNFVFFLLGAGVSWLLKI